MAMLQETRLLAEHLWELPWYENMGRPDLPIVNPPFEFVRCNSFGEACTSALSEPWTTVRWRDLQKKQDMMINYSEQYFRESGVNFAFEIEEIARSIYETKILTKFSHLQLPKYLLLSMMGDINGILKEKENEWRGKSGLFTDNVLFWHEQGVYPCGWIGTEYPNGKMIIY
jgi:hypothetical protein